MTRRWQYRLAAYALLSALLAGGATAALWSAGRTRGPQVVFAGTPPEAVDKMLEAAAVTRDDVVYDLGCGDARFLVTAARRYGCRAVGVELDPAVVAKARRAVIDGGVTGLVEIREGDLFAADLAPATVVALYLLPDLNVKLIPQLRRLRPGARVVSYLFGMEGVRPPATTRFKDSAGHDQTFHLWVAPLEPVGR